MANTKTSTDKTMRNTIFVLFILNLFNLLHGIPYIGYVLFFLNFFICFYYFGKLVSKRDMTKFGWFMFAFFIVWSLSWLLNEKQIYQSSTGTIRNTTELLTPVVGFCFVYYPFYYFAKRGLITTKFVLTFVYVVFVLAAISYFFNYQEVMSDYDSQYGSSNNVGYLFACAMPMLGLLWDKRKRLFYVLMFVALAFALFSAKRGAMLCSLASFAVMFLSVMGSRGNKKGRWGRILLVLLIAVIGSYLFMYMLESNANLQTKMDATEEGNYSGRDVFYLALLDYWLNADTINKIFGIKFMGAVSIAGFDAHNDWLEILIDAGIIGAFFYLCMMVSLWVYTFKNRKWLSYSEEYTLLACASVWLIKSMVSMGFTTPETRMYIIPFAVVSGIIETRKLQNHKKFQL